MTQGLGPANEAKSTNKVKSIFFCSQHLFISALFEYRYVKFQRINVVKFIFVLFATFNRFSIPIPNINENSNSTVNTTNHVVYSFQSSFEASSSPASDPGHGSQGFLEFVSRVHEVNHVAPEVLVVRGEVEVAVAAHGHQDHLLLPGPLAVHRLPDGRRDRVRRLRRRDDALRPRELQGSCSTAEFRFISL
jgi:hypothetical protein